MGGEGFLVIEVEIETPARRSTGISPRSTCRQLVTAGFCYPQAAAAAKPQKGAFLQVSLKGCRGLGGNPKEEGRSIHRSRLPYAGKPHGRRKQAIANGRTIAFYLLMFPLPWHMEAYPRRRTPDAKSLTSWRDAFRKAVRAEMFQ